MPLDVAADWQPTLIRAYGLFAPVLIVWLLWRWRQPDRRLAAGALLATVWQLPALLLVHELATMFDWWRFEADGGCLRGLPVDLYLGWALLWGAAPTLAWPRRSFVWALLVGATLDLVLMPLAAPVVQLGDWWLVGEAIAIGVALTPGLCLGRWTAIGDCLAGRATLQVIGFAGLNLGVLPTIVLEQTGSSWAPVLGQPVWALSLMLQVGALPAIVGLSAVQEFVVRGGGTPFPYDPPDRLVVTGPYAYLANPMQVSLTVLMLMLGLALGSGWLVGATLIIVAYGIGFAGWHERGDLTRRFSADWRDYRRSALDWRPRWRPQYPPTRAVATIYVAQTCQICQEIGEWLTRRHPIGLRFVPAEQHPTHDLWRLTYDPGDGAPIAEGVAALSRALEHLNLAWAFVGWTVRLPVVGQFVQVVVDAVGGEPRRVPRQPETTVDTVAPPKRS